ncbi:MAG: hypothetical protein WCT31_01690 [Candidatus Micrarchaeia archaeon]
MAVAAGGVVLASFECPRLVESIIRPVYASEKSKDTPASYFQRIAKDNSELAPLLENNCQGLRDYLSGALAKLKHATPKDYPKNVFWVKPSSKQLAVLNELQLIKIYYLLKSLSNPAFRAQIGKELEKDTADTSCEHGGVFLFRSGKVAIEMVPNEEIPEGEISIGSHNPDRGYNPERIPHVLNMLGLFHFHARQFGLEYSALSGGDTLEARPYGFTEHFVFSRPDASHFNVDMGIALKRKGKWEVIDIDLGVYSH